MDAPSLALLMSALCETAQRQASELRMTKKEMEATAGTNVLG